jgi:hypothetical protein
MYAELFQAPATLEEPARWLQWAQAASQGTVTPGSDAEKNTRYNLDQFWKALAAVPQTTQAERDAAARMNWWAYATWQALTDKLQWSTNDTSQAAAYAAESAQAAAKKAQLQVPSLNQMNYTAASQRDILNAASNTAQAKAQFLDASYGTAFKDSAANLINQPIFGIPAWAWGLGAVALVVLVAVPRR